MQVLGKVTKKKKSKQAEIGDAAAEVAAAKPLKEKKAKVKVIEEVTAPQVMNSLRLHLRF